jgi:hypothetical protein
MPTEHSDLLGGLESWLKASRVRRIIRRELIKINLQGKIVIGRRGDLQPRIVLIHPKAPTVRIDLRKVRVFYGEIKRVLSITMHGVLEVVVVARVEDDLGEVRTDFEERGEVGLDRWMASVDGHHFYDYNRQLWKLGVNIT